MDWIAGVPFIVAGIIMAGIVVGSGRTEAAIESFRRRE